MFFQFIPNDIIYDKFSHVSSYIYSMVSFFYEIYINSYFNKLTLYIYKLFFLNLLSLQRCYDDALSKTEKSY